MSDRTELEFSCIVKDTYSPEEVINILTEYDDDTRIMQIARTLEVTSEQGLEILYKNNCKFNINDEDDSIGKFMSKIMNFVKEDMVWVKIRYPIYNNPVEFFGAEQVKDLVEGDYVYMDIDEEVQTLYNSKLLNYKELTINGDDIVIEIHELTYLSGGYDIYPHLTLVVKVDGMVVLNKPFYVRKIKRKRTETTVGKYLSTYIVSDENRKGLEEYDINEKMYINIPVEDVNVKDIRDVIWRKGRFAKNTIPSTKILVIYLLSCLDIGIKNKKSLIKLLTKFEIQVLNSLPNRDLNGVDQVSLIGEYYKKENNNKY